MTERVIDGMTCQPQELLEFVAQGHCSWGVALRTLLRQRNPYYTDALEQTASRGKVPVAKIAQVTAREFGDKATDFISKPQLTLIARCFDLDEATVQKTEARRRDILIAREQRSARQPAPLARANVIQVQTPEFEAKKLPPAGRHLFF